MAVSSRQKRKKASLLLLRLLVAINPAVIGISFMGKDDVAMAMLSLSIFAVLVVIVLLAYLGIVKE